MNHKVKGWGVGAGLLILFSIGLTSVFGQGDNGMIDDFERGSLDIRWSWHEFEGFDCTPQEPGYESAYALHFNYTTDFEGERTCWLEIAEGAQWATGEGLSFVWKANQPNLTVGFWLVTRYTDTQEDIFEIWLRPPTADWQTMVLSWDDFRTDEGERGLTTAELEAAQSASLIIGLVGGVADTSIWFDNLRLVSDAAAPSEATAALDGQAMRVPDSLPPAAVPLFEDVPLNATVVPGSSDRIGYTLDGGEASLVTLNFARRAGDASAGIAILSPDGQIAFVSTLIHNSDVTVRLVPVAGSPYTVIVYPLDFAQPPDAVPTIVEILATFK